MSEKLKIRRKALQLTQEQVAQAAGTTKATIMKLERGYMQLTESWLQRLSVPLACRPADLLTAISSQEGVPLIGEISQRGAAKLYRPLVPITGAGEVAPDWKGLERVESPPEAGYRSIIALRVIDDALEPLLGTGSLIYAADLKQSGFDAFLNKLALCQLADGSWVVRRVLQGSLYGHYHLMSLQGVLQTDQEIASVASIIFYKPA